ncbi:unnamed protein product [Rotaria socialis]|uniref:F-box domain-containing protein n=1 Tax=Rotaria socialis TaxID=392032 RepID=A0A818CRS1_9BILA|nr:unnamed protein product [Rotaria socialis]CAF4711745.1 unnamed protein product [Rotaria socialis]
MNRSGANLLDLPDEVLFIILKKLHNIDVLYSLFGINNKRLDILVEDGMFTNILNFGRTSSIIDKKLDRFYTTILPRIHYSVKNLILEATSIERILLVGDYPNLAFLEILNFGQEIVNRYFTDNSALQHILKYQITELVLHNHDKYSTKTSLKTYITHVYAHIMLFQNLKQLTIVASSINEYPPLSFTNLPSTIYFSSTLTVLCICVFGFDDCLLLLDGRLKQLTTFIIQVHNIYKASFIRSSMDELKSLKCFSLISYNMTYDYEYLVLPLLRRMTRLEKLTLCLRIWRDSFIDRAHLSNEFLDHMCELRTITFYISTEGMARDSVYRKSSDDIQKTFTNIKYGPTACFIDHFHKFEAICHVYSLPFTFTRLEKITTHFPNIVLDTVTHLLVFDITLMKHEFFMRISRAFPMLKRLTIVNTMIQSWNRNELKPDKNPFNSIIEFSHLISLDLRRANTDYVVQFLLETRTYLPCLTEFKVNYNDLVFVTARFARDATRRNCFNVKQFIFEKQIYYSKDIYQYFPSLL